MTTLLSDRLATARLLSERAARRRARRRATRQDILAAFGEILWLLGLGAGLGLGAVLLIDRFVF